MIKLPLVNHFRKVEFGLQFIHCVLSQHPSDNPDLRSTQRVTQVGESFEMFNVLKVTVMAVRVRRSGRE